MKFKFGFFAAILAAAVVTTAPSCTDTPTPEPPETINPADIDPVNDWMFKYMQSHYLWNRACNNLTPDYYLDNKEFLTSVLDGIAAQDNINYDDGHWENGQRQQYYSYLEVPTRSTDATRFGEERIFGYGFTGIQYSLIQSKHYFAVLGVTKGSPAETAGLSRGTYITHVDGVAIASNNYNDLYKKLYPSTAGAKVTLTICNILPKTPGTFGNYETTELGDVEMSPVSYLNDPILYSTLIDKTEGSQEKIAYIAYKEFNAVYDRNMVSLFQQLQREADGKITDLVLDLRYNIGGDLTASLVLATLIAGNEYKGEVYTYTTYNEDREQTDAFCIGVKETVEGVNPYVESALAAALNLKRIYVLTGSRTASASELIVNGLRGLDIEVRLIGGVTNGKNVGMEPIRKRFEGAWYTFVPITMRLENKKHYGDYGDGFSPDLNIPNFDNYITGAYASLADPLFCYAYRWISEDDKPTVMLAPTRSEEVVTVGEPRFDASRLHGTLLYTQTEE